MNGERAPCRAHLEVERIVLEAEAPDAEQLVTMWRAMVGAHSAHTGAELEAMHTGQWITVAQAAAMAGVSTTTIFRWIRRGELQTERRPGHQGMMLDRAAFESYLERGAPEPEV